LTDDDDDDDDDGDDDDDCVWSCAQGLNPGQIFHVTVMPCYDKKLEASRPDFYLEAEESREVDLVITSGKSCVRVRLCV